MQKILLASALVFATAACSPLYRQPIHQGNLIDAQAVGQLQPGMNKQQVLALLGTPSLQSPQNSNRWDYTASRRSGRLGRIEVKNFVVHFENEHVSRWEGDYFSQDELALAQEMRKFGNLPRERTRRR